MSLYGGHNRGVSVEVNIENFLKMALLSCFLTLV